MFFNQGGCRIPRILRSLLMNLAYFEIFGYFLADFQILCDLDELFFWKFLGGGRGGVGDTSGNPSKLSQIGKGGSIK